MDIPVIHGQREILIQLLLVVFRDLRAPKEITIPAALRQYMRGLGEPGGYGIRVGPIWAAFVFGEGKINRQGCGMLLLLLLQSWAMERISPRYMGGCCGAPAIIAVVVVGSGRGGI